MIFTLVYVSTATEAFERPALSELLAQCRGSNAEAGVTGALLYRDGTFIQLLEGESDVVRGLYRQISKDSRHRNVTNIWVGHGAERQFPTWTMAFRDLSGDSEALPGFNGILNRRRAGAASEDSSRVLDELVGMFRPIG